jgi:hypothetical protein
MFLDREPYIRLWRPFYFRFGGTIRRLKLIVAGPVRGQQDLGRIEQRLSAIEAQNQQTAAALEQLMLAIINDRGLNSLTASIEKSLADQLSGHTARLTAANDAQWQAIERLLIAALGSSARHSLAAEQMYQFPDAAMSKPANE